MRTEDLLEAIGMVDDDLLERSEEVRIKKSISWKAWIPLAACICLILGGRMLVNGLGMGASKDESAADIGTSMNESDAMMEGAEDMDVPAEENYGESVGLKGEYFTLAYPVAMLEGNENIKASRHVTFDFTGSDDVLRLQTDDVYTFTNISDAEQKVTLYQPHGNELTYEDGRKVDLAIIDEQLGVYVGTTYKFVITIPANGEVTIEGSQYKKGTDWYVPGDVVGVEIVTKLGEHLEYEELKVTVLSDGKLTPVEGNVGFSSGDETVELDPQEELYYFKVKWE